jgi:hypothetical protein
MKNWLPILFFLVAGTVTAQAQIHSSAFYVSWNILKPTSDKNYISETSTAGMRLGYTKFINEKFGLGIEGGYSTLDEYVPRDTYEYPGGAITTDFYNLLYYYTLMANGQYFFTQNSRFMPYGALALGASFNEYRILYNVYGESDSRAAFVFKPEAGIYIKVKEYSNWGLKSSLSYEYSTNKSTQFGINNFSALGFQIGVVFFND